MEKLEALLHYFHVTCKPAVAGMAPMTLARMQANVSVSAADALFLCKTGENVCAALQEATVEYDKQVREFAASRNPPVEVPEADHKWIEFSAVAEKETKAKAKAKAKASGKAKLSHSPILPKVIAYDESGMPLSSQEVKVSTPVSKVPAVAAIPWREWMSSAAAQDLDMAAADMAAVTLVLRSLHCKGRLEDQPIEVSLDLQSGLKAVKVTKDIEEGRLEIPPCAPKSGKIWATSVHPFRVAIRVRDGGDAQQPQRVYYVHPEYKLPEDVTPEETAAVAAKTLVWEWKGDETLHPFWAIKRLSRDALQQLLHKNRAARMSAEFNMEYVERDFNVVTVGQITGDSTSITLTVSVPMLTNTSALQAGDEVLAEVAAKNKCAKRKDTDWKDDRRSAEIAKAKAAKTSAEIAKAKAKAANSLAIQEV